MENDGLFTEDVLSTPSYIVLLLFKLSDRNQVKLNLQELDEEQKP